MDSSSNFTIYLVGFIIVIIGLGIGAHLIGIPPVWIGVGTLVLVGIAVLSAVKRTQGKARPTE